MAAKAATKTVSVYKILGTALGTVILIAEWLAPPHVRGPLGALFRILLGALNESPAP